MILSKKVLIESAISLKKMKNCLIKITDTSAILSNFLVENELSFIFKKFTVFQEAYTYVLTAQNLNQRKKISHNVYNTETKLLLNF